MVAVEDFAMATVMDAAEGLNPSYEEARMREDWPKWQEAIKAELDSLKANVTLVSRRAPDGSQRRRLQVGPTNQEERCGRDREVQSASGGSRLHADTRHRLLRDLRPRCSTLFLLTSYSPH